MTPLAPRAASTSGWPHIVRQRNAMMLFLGRSRAGDLHRKLGGYPGAGHRMPVCCRVMQSMMPALTLFVDLPPKGVGARLMIEFKLPQTEAD